MSKTPKLISIILLSSLFFSIPAYFISSQTPPPAEGDWVISDSTTISDETIILKGNLIITDAGVLTLDNVVLKIDQDWDRQYMIEVQPGGSLITGNNCHVLSNNSFYYYITFTTQSTVMIEDTTIEDIFGTSGVYGLQIDSDDVTITDSHIYGGAGKNGAPGADTVYIMGVSPTIQNCKIYGGCGQDGQNGSDGIDGEVGMNGGAGMPGTDGTNGGYGMVIESGSEASITDSEIYGGTGGNGGNGGKGGNGGSGYMGGEGGDGGNGGVSGQGMAAVYVVSTSSPAFSNCFITGGDGGIGGDGGDGGNGGSGHNDASQTAGLGGNGGDGGSASQGGDGIFLGPSSTPTMYNCEIMGGSNGIGGNGGNGGKGGNGTVSSTEAPGAGDGGNGGGGGNTYLGFPGIFIGDLCNPGIIYSEISGGDGGEAGKGGDGGDGGEGGLHVIEPGIVIGIGTGGDGGIGGNGGDGGNGASAIVVRADLLVTIFKNTLYRGDGGMGGAPGLKGSGGEGDPDGYEGIDGTAGGDGNNGTSLDLGYNSTLIALDTMLQEPRVYYDDLDSTFIQAWFLNVSVEDADGFPVEGATVRVSDSSGSEIYSGETDGSGKILCIICIEFTQTDDNGDHDGDDPDETQYLTPHTVNASKVNTYDEHEVTINENKDIELILENILPSIQIIEPDGVNDIADETYVIQWQDSDPEDDAQIELFYDTDNVGFDGILINQQPISEDSDIDEYTWETGGLEERNYYIYAVIDDEFNSPVSVYSNGQVTIEHPNIPPSIMIESPTGGDVSGIVTIQGTADDPDENNIEAVYVSIDNQEDWELVTGTTSWSYLWNTTEYDDGDHTIYAKSFDGIDYSEIANVTLTVDNIENLAPRVYITYPADNEDIFGEIEITGTAFDDDGNVQLVQIQIDNHGWNHASGTSSWSWTWNTTTYSEGKHIIYAKAKDDLGEYSGVESVTVYVNNTGNTLPVVNIISPVEGTVFGTVRISGTASDVDGDDSILSVQVKIGDDWEDAEGNIYWSYSWDTTTLNDGEYEISARAFDGTVYSITESVTVVVDNPYVPILTVTTDIPKKVSGTLTIQGTASDADGEIAKIEVQIDNGEWKKIEGTTDWSYELDTKELSNKEHTLRIRVFDDEGEYTTETFEFTVDNPAELPWLLLMIVIAIVVILIIIVLLLRKGKSDAGIVTVETLEETDEVPVQKGRIRCPGCGNSFEIISVVSEVQCPYCGLRGRV
ncbi:MAG: hypothetical protein JSV56_02290 [Methanomassiliicoccales archaeon]|nr:MAG: hypothetical protein JSV56_02290 [Methanomassiliicoccales archaeon]